MLHLLQSHVGGICVVGRGISGVILLAALQMVAMIHHILKSLLHIIPALLLLNRCSTMSLPQRLKLVEPPQVNPVTPVERSLDPKQEFVQNLAPVLVISTQSSFYSWYLVVGSLFLHTPTSHQYCPIYHHTLPSKLLESIPPAAQQSGCQSQSQRSPQHSPGCSSGSLQNACRE